MKCYLNNLVHTKQLRIISTRKTREYTVSYILKNQNVSVHTTDYMTTTILPYLVSPFQAIIRSLLEAFVNVQELCDAVRAYVICVLLCFLPRKWRAFGKQTHLTWSWQGKAEDVTNVNLSASKNVASMTTTSQNRWFQ